jgi:hypothetical protein
VRRPKRLLHWIVLVCSAAPGCCPEPVPDPGPAAALREYAASMKQGRTSEARRLLSSRSQQQVDDSSMQQFLELGGEELNRKLSDLSRQDSHDVILKAEIKTREGTQVELVREGGKWRVDNGSVVPTRGMTPEGILEQFLVSIESNDCQGLLACAPPDVFRRHHPNQLMAGCRDQMKSLEELAARIRKLGSEVKRVSENKAEFALEPGHKLVLVKIAERWYIEDL